MHATRDARECAAYRRHIGGLWKLFVDLGATGAQWADYTALSAPLRQQYQALFCERMEKFGLKTFSGALQTHARWRTWAGHNALDWRAPLETVVALWLRSLHGRGPSAAAGALGNLRWLENHLPVVTHLTTAAGVCTLQYSHFQ